MNDVPSHVLVVDDDPDVRTFLRAILEGDGHRVSEAATGAEALAQLGEHDIELVLLDVRMPSMDGFAVAEAIRKRPGPYIPIILLTADDDAGSRARGIGAGADEVLGKPAHPFELRLRVRAMLRIRHLTAQLHLANRRLKLLARTDELTRLRNRRGLRAALEREFHRADRYGGKLSLLALDIDRFKEVNDRYGHHVGDLVLRAVAQAFAGAVRKIDVVGRTGGEEFVVVAPETGSEEACVVAERLRQAAAAARVPLGDKVIQVTVSCGVAAFDDVMPRTADELLDYADRALYRAKARGRDRVERAAPRGANTMELPLLADGGDLNR